jgi:hypothetical protein
MSRREFTKAVYAQIASSLCFGMPSSGHSDIAVATSATSHTFRVCHFRGFGRKPSSTR